MELEGVKEIVRDLAAEFREVELTYLFGSRVKGTPGPVSDYDVAVLLERKALAPEVCARLSSALCGKLGSHRIDVVCLNSAPIELAFSIISSNALLYERDAHTRVEFEARIMSRYFDYLPVLRALRHDILKGGDHATRVQRYREALGRTQRTLGQIRAPEGQAPIRL